MKPSLVRRQIRQLHAYVPGEQPKIRGLIKLNTNENPYPPSPKVIAAIQSATDSRLRLYPNPTAQNLRKEIAKLHRCDLSQVIIGNGSDDLLAMAVRAFVEPELPSNSHFERSAAVSPRPAAAGSYEPGAREYSAASRSAQAAKSTVQYCLPSYSLYPVLADIHGARRNPVALNRDFSLPTLAQLRAGKIWDFRAALTLITTPNAPTGRAYDTESLAEICRAQRGVVLLDEAYVDFAADNAMQLALEHSNVLVARTFSKAFSLCFLRVGYCVGSPELIAALDKIRDSYNVNGLAQVAALATLADPKYYRTNLGRIIATREKLSQDLTALGFEVIPSETNFIFARPPKFPAKIWLEKLRSKRILVRWFDAPATRDFLRISIGTPEEAEALRLAARRILVGLKGRLAVQ